MTIQRMLMLIGLAMMLLADAGALSSRAQTAPALPDHPPPLSPEEELTKLKVADGLEIKLVAAEPLVTQPLSISFDDRGRMWVLQYRQYPHPVGLKPVAVDQYLRTQYDRRPEPPPSGPKGQDRIAVYEDTNGDGSIDKVKDFLTDLNLASGMALGYGGVFVAQPPYLLFYADRDGDDSPDGPPKVLLTGFGMEDAHAFANSLTWGPDGWLYGAQGSTVTALIRGVGFQQGIWRYHPRTDQFELFSEGGGNTWSVEFDQFGNLFPAGNTLEPLEHHVQGAYLVKGFGKHGPLHNPHTYGYFQPVLHHGYVGDSLSGGAIIYQGGALPARFNNACICPHTRHSACRWATIETRGSTFATRAAGDFVTSDDIWFRPVDMTVGPDGAVYIADWYDYNISHSSPQNRSHWYEPSRLDGRVWRIAPPGVPPIKAGSFDLSRKSSAELVDLLSHRNDWYARQARRLLSERCDQAVVPGLTKQALECDDERSALQGLWALSAMGALDNSLAEKALESKYPYVRAWTIRLIGDARIASPALVRRFVDLAVHDPSVVVRSQLACTAKRLPPSQTIPIVERLLCHDEDADDVQMPLLIWWAIEDKAIIDTDAVIRMVESTDLWRRPLMTRFMVERLARRLLAEESSASVAACARLLRYAHEQKATDLVLKGMLLALAGQKRDHLPAPLVKAVADVLVLEPGNPRAIELALRIGVPGAADAAVGMAIADRAPAADRVALIKALGECKVYAAVDSLLALTRDDSADSLRTAAMSAVGSFSDDRIADTVLNRFSALSPQWRSRSIDLMCSRPSWARKLVQLIDREPITASSVSGDQVQRLRQYNDPSIIKVIEKQWGKIRPATPFETQGRVNAVLQLLSKQPGDAARGRPIFEKTCASCHKLHGSGAVVGPDLTGAERKNRELLVQNIVDPSAVIRQEFVSHVATTKEGQVLTGLLAESTTDTVTLVDSKNQRSVLKRTDLEALKESPISLMPEKLLDDLTNQQVCDLLTYLQTDR